MRTQRPISALVLAAGLLATACGGGPAPVASHSPTQAGSPSAPSSAPAVASPSPLIQPITGSYGVLVSPPTPGDWYTVALIGTDGKVAAAAKAIGAAAVSCANSAAAVVPLPVSTSDTRLYFMDASGVVRYLGPDGNVGQATTVPAGTATRRSMFAVSPDDQRIAVVVDDFTSSGASTRLYVENLNGGGSHIELFSETGAYTLWPVGWHGTNNLVVAKVPSCRQDVGIGGNGIIEYHVIDPSTATRRFTIGGTSCGAGLSNPSPAGVVCENPPSAAVVSWTDTTLRTYPIQGPVGAYLSPDGGNVAFVDNVGTSFTNRGSAMAGVFACVWIDNTHVLAGGDSQQQARIGDVTSGTVVPVAAQGDCGGRLPGGL